MHEVMTSYEQRGFAVMDGVLPRGLITKLQDELDRLIGGLMGLPAPDIDRHIVFEENPTAERRDGIEAGKGDAAFIIGDLCRFSNVFRQLLSIEAIVSFAQAALGSNDIVAHLMNATIKHPHIGRRIKWHRDYPNRYITSCASDHLRAMICLDGMVADGGATRFIAGSHRIADKRAAAQAHGKVPHAFDVHDGQAAICRPGSVVFIHPKVLHGSPANASPNLRRNIVLQLGRSDAPIVGERESITGVAISSCSGAPVRASLALSSTQDLDRWSNPIA
ncbi:Phytanoyl-CoA dioxygenase (PhyH) [Novosphingobium sp. CF614]|uniref:phytanoyl-CoA dioxygenase family protein n=1 Tax=Novosphingobium sp. CF614 TaxID=1884364 RepID=UPI0008F3B24B|nr:phytanoyl-CoA dioxygenase family protein [Novosphingobium sp. CF614]SFG16874.1 Phytanoyl-CoA dioxygenase (PhyH) [Novosphingobium sp. CF614]